LRSPSGEVVARQDRGKIAISVVGALAFVVLGALFASYPEHWQTARYGRDDIRVVGWLSASFFSLVFVATVVALARPTTVRISPQALIISGPWTTRTRPWTALSNFRIWRMKGTKLIVFDDEKPRHAWLATINRMTSGATSALPSMMDVEPVKLLEMLQRAKERSV
jgi:hypothetical protein